MASSDADASNARTRRVLELLRHGTVLPAHPLALTAERQLDERRQRALSRYYLAAGAGGLAVGVHTTQFQIHDPEVGLLEPVLALAAEEMNRHEQLQQMPLVRVAGICGPTDQAVEEAHLARDLGYDLGLLSFRGCTIERIDTLIDHCRAVGEAIDLFGFYLQPSVGGRELPYEFWRQFCTIEQVRAIKIAAFDRYRTIDVVRAVIESGRDDIALYTGNDDNIVLDLVTPYTFRRGDQPVTRRMAGGLLGQWAVWTRRAVELWEQCRLASDEAAAVEHHLLRRAVELTDANSAIFDAANDFRGCVPGIHEVLRRQGLLAGTWCLDPEETLSPGQADEIKRVADAYPELVDDAFVEQHRDDWLRG